MSALVLWDTGEAELGFALVETGEVRPEHRDIDGPASPEDASKAVLDWVSVTAWREDLRSVLTAFDDSG
ncbi:hypothetical protein [Streptosporangium saharense]|uniref:hypothetical protein n=1 Tax=Streptosporangium saharense TaxID=1706840 RepID=UPI00332C8652